MKMKKQNNSIVKISNTLTSSPQSNALSKRGLSDMGISSEIENLINKMDEYALNEEYEKAIAIDKKILSIDPANIRANFNLAFCNGRLKRYKKALFYYDKTLKLDKNHIRALTNKAMILSDTGDPRSDEAWENLLNLGKEKQDKSVIIAALNNLKRYKECLKICNEILTEDEYNFDGLFYKGLASLNLEEYQDALEAANKILSFLPSNIHAMNIKGEVFLQNKMYKDALETYTKILEILPNDPQAIRALKEIAEALGPQNLN
jgi:tetratricopeptide (TPR) repeat protein